MGLKIHNSHKVASLLFLASTLMFLTGADNDQSTNRGTLPLRGDGTLPLMLPDGGTLPLIVAGVAINPTIVVPPNRKPKETALSLDLMIARKAKPAVEIVAPAEATIENPESEAVVDAGPCSEVFGPIWETATGVGTLLVGTEHLNIEASCINTLTNDVALIASIQREETKLSCLVTALRTTVELSALSGELACSLPVAGSALHVFKALSKG
jgi:hypothetical protein